MWHHFHEIEVVLGYLFNLVFEAFVHFTIFHKHVKNCVLAIVDFSELLFDVVEIVRVPES